MLRSAYDIRQTPDRSLENTHNVIEMSRRSYEYATLNRCVFRLLLKISMDWAHLMEIGSVFHREGVACAKQRFAKTFQVITRCRQEMFTLRS